jgi:uncharacterized SAM-binding protein YcdF (DUF218 family)
MFFWAAKGLWVLAQPSNLLLLLLAAGALALWFGRRRLAAWLLSPAVLALMVIGLFPVGEWLLVPLENRFHAAAEPPAEVDGVIVLGGAVNLAVAKRRGVATFHESAERDIAMIELAKRYPEARLVYTGRSYWRPFLQRHGLEGRVILEKRAGNTYQNAVLSKALAAPAPGERWLLVTSAAHMPRSVGVFRQVGWPVIPYPVDYRTKGDIDLLVVPNAARRWREFDHAIKSWAGLVAYRLTGRSSALFPAP